MLPQRLKEKNGRDGAAGRRVSAAIIRLLMPCLGLCSWGAMASCELPARGEAVNIDKLYAPMVECLKQGRTVEAGKLYYAVELRMRALAKVDAAPGGTRQSVETLQREYGPKINGYLGGNIDEWLVVLDWANDFDSSSAWPEMGELFAKTADPAAAELSRVRARSELSSLRKHVSGLDKAAFYAKRAESGLPVRDLQFKGKPVLKP